MKLPKRTIQLQSAPSWLAFAGLAALAQGCEQPKDLAPLPNPTGTPTMSPIEGQDPNPRPSLSPSPTPSPSGPPLPADHLTWTAGPASMTAGQCGNYTVAARNAQGMPVPLAQNVLLHLSASGPGRFFLGAGCTGEPIETLTLHQSLPLQQISFIGNWAGHWVLSARDVSPINPLTGVDSEIRIGAGPLQQLILQGPVSIPIQTCSGPYTLGARDAYGNPARLTSLVMVGLSGSGTIHPDSRCSKELNPLVAIGPGQESTFFYMSLPTEGAGTVRAQVGLIRGEMSVTGRPECLNPLFSDKLSDVFQLKKGRAASARGLATDSKGRVLVVGSAQDKKNRKNWVIRRGDSSGWSTVDIAQLGDGFDAEAVGLIREPSGALLAIGSGADATSLGSRRMMARRSDLGDNTGNEGQWKFVTSGMPWNFSGNPNRPTQGSSLAFDPFGRVIVRGSTIDSDWSRRLLVRIGSPSLTDWLLGAGFPLPNDGRDSEDLDPLSTSSQNLVIDAAGRWWTTAGARGADLALHWHVLMSADRGETWTSMDGGVAGFQLQAGRNSSPRSIAIDTRGRILVAGYGDFGNERHWVLRSSEDDGLSWTTLDDFRPLGDAEATALTVDPSGTAWITGRARINPRNESYSLLVRKEFEGTFQTAQIVQLDRGKSAVGKAIGYDSRGNIFVAGSAYTPKGQTWIVTRTQCN